MCQHLAAMDSREAFAPSDHSAYFGLADVGPYNWMGSIAGELVYRYGITHAEVERLEQRGAITMRLWLPDMEQEPQSPDELREKLLSDESHAKRLGMPY